MVSVLRLVFISMAFSALVVAVGHALSLVFG